MTPRQRETLDFIDGFIANKGHAPSYDEIRERFGLASKSGAHRIVHALLDRGYLRREGASGVTRSLVVARVGQGGLARFTDDELRSELARRAQAVAP